MKIKVYRYSLFALMLAQAVLFFSFIFPPKPITVFMAGDSTMSVKDVNAYPETGWGMPFVFFFDSSVTIDNQAKNGRSTKSFINEGLWKLISDKMKEGDYLFIQFGHNDEVPTKTTYTSPQEFTANLIKFITEARAKKVTPVLITPVARRKFNSEGVIEGTHEAYSELVRKVATAQKVPLIDLDKESQALLQKMGPEDSKLLYNHLVPGENPNYPGGKTDDTHFSELGARKMAEIVLADIRSLKLDLADRITSVNK